MIDSKLLPSWSWMVITVPAPLEEPNWKDLITAVLLWSGSDWLPTVISKSDPEMLARTNGARLVPTTGNFRLPQSYWAAQPTRLQEAIFILGCSGGGGW